MNTEQMPHASKLSTHHRKRALLGSAAALGFALALAASPAEARRHSGYGVYSGYGGVVHAKKHGNPKERETEHVSKEPFGAIPKGPLQIFISINQEKLHLYSGGVQVTEVPIATGLPGHPTPMGAFSVIQKDRYHHSNIYSGAPMPYMQRITWSGVAMHEGVSLGHPASHGCIRMPHDFAAKLWVLTKLGVRVIIARPELKPTEFADQHLFVHKEPAAAAIADPVKTAQSVDDSKKTDAADAPAKTDSAKTDPAVAPSAEAPKSEIVKSDRTPAGEAQDTPPAADTPATTGTTAAAPAVAAKPADAPGTEPSLLRGTAQTDVTAPIAAPGELVPVPLPKPARLAELAAASHEPISIFVSRKEKKIFVRQHFSPLFAAPITIAHPEQAFGTHVFTAMEYLGDNSTFRWNVVSLAGEPARPARPARSADSERRYDRYGRIIRHHEEREVSVADTPAPQSPGESLARLEIPQDVIDRISALMVPGSSLIVSDQGLGPETGEGTDFIVLTR